MSEKMINYICVFFIIIAIGMLIDIFADYYDKSKNEMNLERILVNQIHGKIIVATNLPCRNCKNTIFQAIYDPEVSKDYVWYVCCCCGYYRLYSHWQNVIHRAASLKMFKQDYNNWREDFSKYNIDDCYIASYTYEEIFE
jgi:hypothetical protein